MVGFGVAVAVAVGVAGETMNGATPLLRRLLHERRPIQLGHRIETKMDIYGKWDVRILAVLIIGGLIAGWMIR